MTDYVMYSYSVGTVTATVFIDLNQFITNIPIEDYETTNSLFENSYTAHVLLRENTTVSTDPPTTPDHFDTTRHGDIEVSSIKPVAHQSTNNNSETHDTLRNERQNSLFEYQVKNKIGDEQCGHHLNVNQPGLEAVTTHIPVPRSHFLHAIQRVRRLNKLLPATITNIIGSIFPQNNKKSALHSFTRQNILR